MMCNGNKQTKWYLDIKIRLWYSGRKPQDGATVWGKVILEVVPKKI